MKNTKEVNRLEGTVEEMLPAAKFRVKLDDERLIIGHLSGKMRKFRIKIVPGDRVLLEFSPYDKDLGRITRRL
ncbi:MAG: translation initiation factor IF-1 [bacterium]|jgi:translation initiation factor IF-1|nr:translation initiation factor IF-1 [bacterium]